MFGLPDYASNQEWMLALDDILRIFGADPKQATFFGGCQEEVDFFYQFGRRVEILNRFDGSTPKVSATEVRDALIRERSLEKLLNPRIVDAVRSRFEEKWELFKKV